MPKGVGTEVPSKPIQLSNWDETATVSSSVTEHDEYSAYNALPFIAIVAHSKQAVP